MPYENRNRKPLQVLAKHSGSCSHLQNVIIVIGIAIAISQW